MEETDYTREEDFQQLLENFPDLLAGEQINSYEPRRWLFVAREVGIPGEENGSNRWALDHLFLDQDAIPTFVEVKRKSDTRLRREVVGQMLDYAANATVYLPENEIERLFITNCEELGQDPDEKLSMFLRDNADHSSFWDRAKSNLKEGKVRLVFVADRIPTELQRIIEFLNERMQPTEVLGVEIRQFTGEGFSTHIPRVIGQTGEAKLNKGARSQTTERAYGKWNKATFLDDARTRGLKEEHLNAISQIYDFAEQEQHQSNPWGSGTGKGSFNPKFSEVSRRSPFTIWSDGILEFKFSWLTDSSNAERFCEIFQSELIKAGVPIPAVAKGNRDPRVPVTEWVLWMDQLISATRAALNKYRVETNLNN
ncbi:MAG: hypothetical protein AUG51_06840 [Acidobacteria bacterium 13_1_20CM_3_53_8]|nr:MAG: hypothetical protein AUG51_06840 [Acidobacteria bacterium 13_1_20CM_3_53_8]